MKVYQINSVCGFGSTGRIVMDLADTLQQCGYDCRIGHGRGNCSDGRTFRIETGISLRFHGVLSRITDRQGFYSTRATRRLIDDIRQYAPDVIHLHNLHGYYLNFNLLFDFLAQYNRPVVWTLHDCWAFTGHCSHFEHVGCDKWRTMCHHCPQKKRYPISYLADNSKKNYLQKMAAVAGLQNLTVVTPSVWLAELVKQSFLHNAQVVCIPNGIDLSVFRPIASDIQSRCGIEGKKMILGVASKWDDRKGLDDFILLSSSLPEEYKIVLVGLSQKQLEALPPQILGLLRTNSPEELAQLYSAADVFVNPTYEDTFPTTNLEALACGTPVITYRTGGSPESIVPGCGRILEKQGSVAENVQAVKEAILALRADRELCGLQGAKYEKNQQYARYISLYEQLLRE